MKKLIVTALLLLFAMVNISPSDYENIRYQVLEKREMLKDGNTILVVVLVRFAPNENYADYLKYPRLRFEVEEGTYDLLVKKGIYSLKELKIMGVEITAEQKEEEQRKIAQLREIRRKEREEKVMARANDMQQAGDSLRAYLLGIAQDGKVTPDEMSELESKYMDYFSEKESLEEIADAEFMSRLRNERAEDFLLEQKAEKIIDTYYRKQLIYKDKNHEIADFFKELTGLEQVKVKSKRAWGKFFSWGVGMGILFSLLAAMGIVLVMLIIGLIAGSYDTDEIAFKVGLILWAVFYIAWLVMVWNSIGLIEGMIII